VENVLLPAARQEAQKTLDPAQPLPSLLDAVDEMIERDFFNAEPLRPIHQIGVCLKAWGDSLEKLLGQRQASDTPRLNAVVTDILAHVKQGLDGLQARVPPLSWTGSDVMPLVAEALDAHWDRIAEALLHENSLGSIKATLRVLALRRQTLEALRALAWQRRSVSERSRLADEENHVNGASRAESLYSTPLCISLDSANALDAVTARDLRQSLLKPILTATVLSIRDLRPDLADVKPVEDRLTASLGRLTGEMKRFLKDIETHGWDLFRNGFGDRRAINDHPYYRSVCEIWRLAEPKIDLSKSRKFAAPLDVTVVQQVPHSCVPRLLTHNCEVSVREANVDENYRHVTGEWVQILRLRYGFCLEAITRYHRYVTATEEYVRHMGFEYSDLWLDKNWYIAYRSSLVQWHSQTESRRDVMEKKTYETNAAKVGSLRVLLDSVSERLRQQMRQLTDLQVSLRMAELHGGMDSRVGLVLHDLPLGDAGGVRQGLDRCLGMTEGLIQNLEDCGTQLSDRERQLLQAVLASCRGDLQRFRDGQLA